jgi:hypothetical protein
MKAYHAANPVTPEARGKMSERREAYFAANPGAREKYGEKMKAYFSTKPFWWTNGVSNTRRVDCPGPGWVKGRTPKRPSPINIRL